MLFCFHSTKNWSISLKRHGKLWRQEMKRKEDEKKNKLQKNNLLLSHVQCWWLIAVIITTNGLSSIHKLLCYTIFSLDSVHYRLDHKQRTSDMNNKGHAKNRRKKHTHTHKTSERRKSKSSTEMCITHFRSHICDDSLCAAFHWDVWSINHEWPLDSPRLHWTK